MDEGTIQTRGGMMYYEDDGLGNVMDITDHLGNNVMSYRYDAFATCSRKWWHPIMI